MGDNNDYEVGQRLELADGRIGIVQFVGTTHFADGPWIGLVLEDQSGKNDGSVQGQRYFRCEPGRGMFVRPAGVASILGRPAPPPAAKAKPNQPQAPAAAASKPRLSVARPSNAASVTKRPGILDPTERRRSAINVSPSPAGRPAARTQTLRVGNF